MLTVRYINIEKGLNFKSKNKIIIVKKEEEIDAYSTIMSFCDYHSKYDEK